MTKDSKTLELQPFTILSDHGIAVLHHNGQTGQFSLHASVNKIKGAVFAKFKAGSHQITPTRFTVQISENDHIELHPTFLQFINHSCNPNLFFNLNSMQVDCLQNINPGDELTYFYPSTEWWLQESFICHCGSKNCIGEIKGAAFLSWDLFKRYKFTPFILEKLKSM